MSEYMSWEEFGNYAIADLAYNDVDCKRISESLYDREVKITHNIHLQFLLADKDKKIDRLKEINKRFRDAIIKTSFCDGLALVLDIENQVALERTGQ